jgi:FkbM family methyltransferase
VRKVCPVCLGRKRFDVFGYPPGEGPGNCAECAGTGWVGAQADVVTDGIFVTRDFKHGRIKYLSTDYGVGQMITLYGEYSEGEVALFRKLLKPGDTVVSAGGNIGVHLIPLSRIVRYEGGVVITFEPQTFIREHLLGPNLAMNGCVNVIVYPEALGAERATAYLPSIDYTMPNNFGGMEIRAAGPVPIDVITLDSLGLEKCQLLMLDVEGFELNALRGARETIMRCRPYLYVEIDRPESREQVLAYMAQELKYELLFHTPTCFNRDNFAGNPDNKFGSMCNVMCLGIPA